MADVIDYIIHGDEMQLVEVRLDPGEGVRAEAGTMMYMDADVRMQTGTDGGQFDAEGFILQRLEGDGRPFSRLADRIFAAAKSNEKGEKKGVGGLGGDLLGGILQGDR